MSTAQRRYRALKQRARLSQQYGRELFLRVGEKLSANFLRLGAAIVQHVDALLHAHVNAVGV